jgi:hypothetical protein
VKYSKLDKVPFQLEVFLFYDNLWSLDSWCSLNEFGKLAWMQYSSCQVKCLCLEWVKTLKDRALEFSLMRVGFLPCNRVIPKVKQN